MSIFAFRISHFRAFLTFVVIATATAIATTIAYCTQSPSSSLPPAVGMMLTMFVGGLVNAFVFPIPFFYNIYMWGG